VKIRAGLRLSGGSSHTAGVPLPVLGLWCAAAPVTQVSAESAPWQRQLRCICGQTVFFCRQIAAGSVENAEASGFE